MSTSHPLSDVAIDLRCATATQQHRNKAAASNKHQQRE
jgi:hypothetical protein